MAVMGQSSGDAWRRTANAARDRALKAEAEVERLREAGGAVLERLALGEDITEDEYEALRVAVEEVEVAVSGGEPANSSDAGLSSRDDSDRRPRHYPTHACVSWTYVGPERAEEALLRIRRALKEHAGWWTEHDAHLEREAFKRLGIDAS